MMSKRIKTTILLLSMVALVGGSPFSRVLAQSASAALAPISQNIAVGQQTTVTLRLQNVNDLYGYQTAIVFNPSVLEVIDADTAKAGIQVALGTFLQAGVVPQNSADNSVGTIVCVVSQLAPAGAVSGSGDLLTITFRGKVQGHSEVRFTDLKMAQPNGVAITVTRQDAQIIVGSPTGATPTFTPTPTPTPTPTGTYVVPTATPTPVWSTPTPWPTIPPGQQVIYVVQMGDTLYSIARRHGTTVEAIAQVNDIANVSYIQAGQQLIIPRGTPVTPGPPPPQPGPSVYVIQHGDTLYSLARRFGTTVEALALANHIANPSRIYAGQQLTIPGGYVSIPQPQPSGNIHVVQPGETLCSIARHYGTTFWAIAIANHMSNPNIIYVGQSLVIP